MIKEDRGHKDINNLTLIKFYPLFKFVEENMLSKLSCIILFAISMFLFTTSDSFAQSQSDSWGYSAPGNESCGVSVEAYCSKEFSNGVWHNSAISIVNVVSQNTDPVPVSFFVNYILVVKAGNLVDYKQLNCSISGGDPAFMDYVMIDDFNSPIGYAEANSSVCFSCSTDDGYQSGEANAIVQ